MSESGELCQTGRARQYPQNALFHALFFNVSKRSVVLFEVVRAICKAEEKRCVKGIGIHSL